MLHLIQIGSGERRPLVLAYFVANTAALLGALPPEACVLVDNDDAGGRFAKPAGAGGVDTIARARAAALAQAGARGAFSPSALVLIGWSAGCQAVREQLRAGADPDAVLALDGVSGSWPSPTATQIDPWKALAARARAGDALFVLTHTLQTYTEKLQRGAFASTLSMARIVTGLPLEDAGPVTAPAEARDGDLVVLSYRSATVDGQAHLAQQAQAMPDILRRILVPALPAPAAASPAQQAPEAGPVAPPSSTSLYTSIGEAAIAVGLAELAAGVHEVMANWSTRIAQYFKGCVRGGRFVDGRLVGARPLGIDRGAWCSAAVGFEDAEAAKMIPGAVPPPWRAAAHERVEDARALGIWEPKGSGYTGRRGDVAIFARGTGEPEKGGEGHAARVIDAPDAAGAYRTLDGNHDDGWAEVSRTTADADFRGWIRYT